MTEREQHRPKIAVAALVVNEAGKVLVVQQSPKWQDKYVVPGGHIEWGEDIEHTLRREIKEETGLSIDDFHFIKPFQIIFTEDYHKDRHVVSLLYVAHTKDAENKVVLEKKELSAYLWLAPEELQKHAEVHPSIKLAVTEYQKILEEKSYKNLWQRALADYQNLKKETAARQAEWAAMSEQQILEEFIPVYDHFKTAFYHHPKLNEEDKQVKNWIDGIGYIMKQFGDILKSHNIQEIKTVGEKFDPRFHESAGEATESESDDSIQGKKIESGSIVREVSGGYKMGERVIKAARVIVKK